MCILIFVSFSHLCKTPPGHCQIVETAWLQADITLCYTQCLLKDRMFLFFFGLGTRTGKKGGDGGGKQGTGLRAGIYSSGMVRGACQQPWA
jgi:hypothetical protein